MLYKFGPFILNNNEGLLLRDGEVVPITPKAFEILLILVSNHGHLVAKRELFDKIWPNIYVEESTLAQNIFTLRKVLGLSPTGQQYIQTIRKRGYRFASAVEVISEACAPLTGDGDAKQQVGAEEALNDPSSRPNDNDETNKARSPITNENISADSSIVSIVRASRVRRQPTKRWRWIDKYNYLKRPAIILGLIIIAAVAILSLTLKRYLSQVNETPFQRIKITNVTTGGNTWATAISPDGKYVAYVMVDNGQSSLRVKQIDAVSPVEVLGPIESQILGMTFTPDGKNIFYIEKDLTTNTFVLDKIPMLGGAPKQILRDIGSPVTFSPDGKRLAFIRTLTQQNEMALIVANADGSQEQTLATRRSPLYYRFEGPAWSPDGKKIACAAGISGGRTGLVEVSVENGVEREITPPIWVAAGKVVWLADGKGLIVSADAGNSAYQLWRVAYPGGEVSQITEGLSSYVSPSLSADSKVLVAIQIDQFLEVAVASMNDLSHPRRLTPMGGKFNSIVGFSWTPDGKISYSSEANENADVWIVQVDGREPRQLTADARANIFPMVSPDGKQIVFISDRSGSQQLWLMDINGNGQVQLTKDEPTQKGAKVHLHWSPDSQWVIYTLYGEQPTVWKIPVNGGHPVQLTTSHSYGGTISPDNKLIAYYTLDDKTHRVKLAVSNLNSSNQNIREFGMLSNPYGGQIQWNNTGSALLYIVNLDGKALLLSQPISGGPPQQLLNLSSGLIEFFALSPDNTQLLYSNCFRTYEVTRVIDLKSR